MTGPTEQEVRSAIRRFLDARRVALGLELAEIDFATNVFEEGILDSMSLAELVIFVEGEVRREIDFIEVDPDNLDTVDGIVKEFIGAIVAGDG